MDYIRKLKHTAYYYGAKFNCFPSFFNSINSSDNTITQQLVDKDLKRLDKLSKGHKMQQINSIFDHENKFIEQYHLIIKSFQKIFNIEDYPKLYLVDTFPDVFSDKAWDSMSIDKNDEVHFSIPRGIYYKKEYLTHCYFEFIIAHEIVHWIISEYSEKYFPYVPLIEEGVCDFLGTYILVKNKILDYNVIENLIIYNRALKNDESLWKQYWKNYLLISSIVCNNGLTFVIDAIKEGREHISLLTREYNHKNWTKDVQQDIETKNIFNIFLKANSISTLKAKEFLLLEYINCNFAQKIIEPKSIILDLSEDEISILLKKLEILGFIHSYKQNLYFNPNFDLLSNIKYSLW